MNPVRLVEPDLGPDVEELVLRVLRGGRLAQGPVVERFEALCAGMAGTTAAVAVANGTVSLEASLHVLGVRPGDEVVTSPLTFPATVNAVLRAGATVRFADVCDDHTVDPDAAAALVGPRTSVLLPVHLYGLPADLPALVALARRDGLAILEDAAQAHGVAIDGVPVGGAGLGSFSFYATKNVGAGEGGCVTTSDEELARRLRVHRNQGMVARYEHVAVGTNLRLSDLHAAVAVPQLERLSMVNAARARNAEALTAGLTGSGLELPVVPPGRTHVWHQYTVLVPDAVDRDAVVRTISARGVEAGVHYPRLAWDHPPYRDHPGVVVDDTPRARDVVRRCLSLPVHQRLSPSDVDRVVDATLAALRHPAHV